MQPPRRWRFGRAIVAVAAVVALGAGLSVAASGGEEHRLQVSAAGDGRRSPLPGDEPSLGESGGEATTTTTGATTSTRPARPAPDTTARPTTSTTGRTTTTTAATTSTTEVHSGAQSEAWPGPMGPKPKNAGMEGGPIWEGKTSSGQPWVVSGFDPGPAGAAELGLYVVDADGSHLRRLSYGWGDLTWSPDFRWIARMGGPSIISPETGQDIHISAINPNPPEGSAHGGIEGGTPSWSPDSQRLAFVVKEDYLLHDWNLVIVRIDGTAPRLVIPIPGGDAYNEAWLPDGRVLVLDAGGLWVVQPDGTDLHRVYTAALKPGRLTPSPDGRTVAVTEWDTTGTGTDRVTLVDIEAGTARPACGDGTLFRIREPHWSPEGTQLVCPVLQDGRETTVIWRVDGGAITRLDAGLGRPVWSPRGDAIAGVGSGSGPDRDLVVEAPDGSGRRVLVSAGNHPIETVIWSPDGRQIAFAVRP